MCVSLSESYNVSLVVADSKGDEVTNFGVSIYDVGKLNGRLNRMLKTTKSVFLKAKELQADLYHIHDPELIPVGVKLKNMGFKVIFDAHEDLPKQLLSKPYLSPLSRRLLSYFFEHYEKRCFKRFDAVIGATKSITKKLLVINSESVDINNYPILGELNKYNNKFTFKNVCYLGGINEIRGIKEVVKSLGFVSDVTLQLAGKFSDSQLEAEVKSYEGWSKVNQLGFINREQAAQILSSSIAGLVTFHPYPNHTDAQPNKMFEYMSAGIPVICSNFPLWREIIESNHCGICVDPLDENSIAKAIRYLVDNPEHAKVMGENGLKAITYKYNWDQEKKKLFDLYARVL